MIKSPGFTKYEIIQSIAFSAIVMAAYFYWFSIADRNSLFLYGSFGWGPFHSTTKGRYWMTGLVLSSIITVLYVLLNFFLVKTIPLINKYYRIPSWTHIWLLCLPVITIGIPIILINSNSPVIHSETVVLCVLTVTAGLAIGFYNADLILTGIKKFLLLSLAGIGLIPVLLFIRVLELPSKGILNLSDAIVISAVSILFSAAWVIVITLIYKRMNIIPFSAFRILISGFFYSYLLLPLIHYLFATPAGRPYITSSGNFFADSIFLKIATWITAVIIVYTAAEIRNRKSNINLNQNTDAIQKDR